MLPRLEIMESEAILAIGSQLEDIELAQTVVEETLAGMDLSSDDAYAVGMAVREAVANAVSHGNQGDPDKRVVVTFGLNAKEVVVRVEDEGPGFDPAAIPDPRARNNLMRPNGRGMLFMRKFMDRIEYTFGADGGTTVTLRKRLSKASERSSGEEKNE
jgi:serine/threonine-protein kinase RsbW